MHRVEFVALRARASERGPLAKIWGQMRFRNRRSFVRTNRGKTERGSASEDFGGKFKRWNGEIDFKSILSIFFHYYPILSIKSTYNIGLSNLVWMLIAITFSFFSFTRRKSLDFVQTEERVGIFYFVLKLFFLHLHRHFGAWFAVRPFPPSPLR